MCRGSILAWRLPGGNVHIVCAGQSNNPVPLPAHMLDRGAAPPNYEWVDGVGVALPLARAILLDTFRDEMVAESLALPFATEVVVKQNPHGWCLSKADVHAWVMTWLVIASEYWQSRVARMEAFHHESI